MEMNSYEHSSACNRTLQSSSRKMFAVLSTAEHACANWRGAASVS